MNASLQKQLDKSDLHELKEIEQYVNALMKQKKRDERNNVISQLKNLASERGFTLDELVGASGGKGVKIGLKKNFKAKYQNPENPSQRWTGLGRKPIWVRDQLAMGKELTDLLIPNAA